TADFSFSYPVLTRPSGDSVHPAERKNITWFKIESKHSPRKAFSLRYWMTASRNCVLLLRA
ncbi:hypothetical protein, partial [Escherichia coli]|uniref:hypothetical protein n=1 Tax=Escherichia coli TaxID=562 RepID=UPI003EE2005C